VVAVSRRTWACRTALQRAMGHAKASTTLNTYMHLWPTAEDRTRNAAANMMREATGTRNLADSVRTNEGD
jgi:integrase